MVDTALASSPVMIPLPLFLLRACMSARVATASSRTLVLLSCMQLTSPGTNQHTEQRSYSNDEGESCRIVYLDCAQLQWHQICPRPQPETRYDPSSDQGLVSAPRVPILYCIYRTGSRYVNEGRKCNAAAAERDREVSPYIAIKKVQNIATASGLKIA